MSREFDYDVWLAEHDLVDLAKHGQHNQASHGNRYGADGKRVRTAAGGRRRKAGIEAARESARKVLEGDGQGNANSLRSTRSAGGWDYKREHDETGDVMFSTSGHIPRGETKGDRHVSGTASRTKGYKDRWQWQAWNHDDGETIDGEASSWGEAKSSLDAALKLWGAQPGKAPTRSVRGSSWLRPESRKEDVETPTHAERLRGVELWGEVGLDDRGRLPSDWGLTKPRDAAEGERRAVASIVSQASAMDLGAGRMQEFLASRPDLVPNLVREARPGDLGPESMKRVIAQANDYLERMQGRRKR